LNEDDDYSSSDEPEDQQIFDFKGVVGIRKHGSTAAVASGTSNGTMKTATPVMTSSIGLTSWKT
jgi:hypothetical protein